MRTYIALLPFLTSTFVNAVPQKEQHEAIVHCLAAANVPQDIPGTANFTRDIVPYNLRLQFTPVALATPSTVAQVQAAASCAARLGVTVSPRSGGHSYASHDLGGEDGHLVIDLKLFNSVSVDSSTDAAEIGPGQRV
jgi:FAD/FMN-containing dehydrogenase